MQNNSGIFMPGNIQNRRLDAAFTDTSNDVAALDAALAAHIADSTDPHGANLTQTNLAVTGTLTTGTISSPGTSALTINTGTEISSSGWIKTDHIGEKTASAGVTFESLVVANNMLSTTSLFVTSTPLTISSDEFLVRDNDGYIGKRTDVATLEDSQDIKNKLLEDDSVQFYNKADPTKILKFDVSTTDPNTTVELSVPEASGTIVTEDGDQVLTQKALEDDSISFYNKTNPDRRLKFDLTNAAPANTNVISIPVISTGFPATDEMIVGTATQTMSNKTFSDTVTAAGVALSTNPTLDNTQTAILARNSTTGAVVRRDDIVDTSSTQTLTGKTISSSNNTININTTNINDLINQDLRTTATPHFDALMIDSPVSTGDVDLSTNNDQKNRKIVLYQTPANPSSDHRFFGIGLQSAEFRFQVSGTNGNYNFYAATGASNSTNVFSIRGTGGIQFPNSTTGYSPTSLNYYENLFFNVTFTGAATINVPIFAVRIGPQVTLHIPQFTGTYASNTTLSVAATSIPARFRPAADYADRVTTINNGSHDEIPGWLAIYANGGMLLERRASSVYEFTAGSIGKALMSSHTYYVS